MSESPEVAEHDVASPVRDVDAVVEEALEYARSSTDLQEVEARYFYISVLFLLIYSIPFRFIVCMQYLHILF